MKLIRDELSDIVSEVETFRARLRRGETTQAERVEFVLRLFDRDSTLESLERREFEARRARRRARERG